LIPSPPLLISLKKIFTVDFIEKNSKKNSTADSLKKFFLSFYRIFQGVKKSVTFYIRGRQNFFFIFVNPIPERRKELGLRTRAKLGLRPSFAQKKKIKKNISPKIKFHQKPSKINLKKYTSVFSPNFTKPSIRHNERPVRKKKKKLFSPKKVHQKHFTETQFFFSPKFTVFFKQN
jgi:hypothetical protein